VSGHPLLVGFGISGPESAARLAPYCDGIIVGSALIRRIEDSPDVPTAVARVREFVAGLRTALE
ncbi:MAG: tryptophan synthase subunit alpha, partial [Calditrichaeota bacterium]